MPQSIEIYLEWPGLDPDGPEVSVEVTQDMGVMFAEVHPTRLTGVDGYLREEFQDEPTGSWRILRGLVGPTIWAIVRDLARAGNDAEIEVDVNADDLVPLTEVWASVRELGESNTLRPMPDPEVARQMGIVFADPTLAARVLDRMDRMFEELDREPGHN